MFKCMMLSGAGSLSQLLPLSFHSALSYAGVLLSIGQNKAVQRAIESRQVNWQYRDKTPTCNTVGQPWVSPFHFIGGQSAC